MCACVCCHVECERTCECLCVLTCAAVVGVSVLCMRVVCDCACACMCKCLCGSVWVCAHVFCAYVHTSVLCVRWDFFQCLCAPAYFVHVRMCSYTSVCVTLMCFCLACLCTWGCSHNCSFIQVCVSFCMDVHMVHELCKCII